MDDISNRLVRGKYFYLVENIQTEDAKPSILFWLALPINHKGQKVNIHSIHPVPAEIIEDNMDGNRIVFWKITELKDVHSLQFDYEFDVLAEDVEHEVDVSCIKPYDTESEYYKFYTKSEPWIEITPEITQKANEIIGTESNPYTCAKLLYDWVINNMVYVYPDVNDRGAEKSFKRLTGDCGEFSFVFIAMCRAIGIPTRSVTAVWPTESGHAWAEIMIEPYGWIPVDATVAQDFTPQLQNVTKAKRTDKDYLFGNLYPNRLIVLIGNNSSIVTKDNQKRTFRILQPGGSCSYPISIEFTGISDQVIHTGFYLFDEEIDNIELYNARKDKEFAQDYFQPEDYDQSEVSLTNIVSNNPDAVLSWFYLGQVYMNKSNPEEAIRCFLNSIQNDQLKLPEMAAVWAYNLLGSCYMHTQNIPKAIESFQFVLNKGINYQGALDYAKEKLTELSV